mmetsp:Transcript_3219/g.5435  ORF Transcript_3219/g.5435 Transcript_3219/m.5435 type:complete len:231 (+) Transcript_3219:874-1566(+)
MDQMGREQVAIRLRHCVSWLAPRSRVKLPNYAFCEDMFKCRIKSDSNYRINPRTVASMIRENMYVDESTNSSYPTNIHPKRRSTEPFPSVDKTHWTSRVPELSNNITPAFQSETCLAALLLVRDDLLDTNSGLDSNHNRILSTVPSFTDLISKALRVSWKVEISLLVPSFVHKSELVIVANVNDFPLGAVHNGDCSSVGGRNHIFELLASENIGGDKVTLSVTVLPGLGD